MDKTYFSVTRLDKRSWAHVAEQRLQDAQALIDTGKGKHANAALYLLGYVVEILLKSELVGLHADMVDRTTAPKGKMRDLIWRKHDWVKILELKDLEQLQHALNRRGLLTRLKKLGAIWTIEIRYSPAKIGLNEVRKYAKWVNDVKEVFQ